MTRPARLDDAQVDERLGALPAGWERQVDEIVKTFELPSFPEAIAFVTRIAERAEAADHHPDLDIRYRKVRVALSTHDAGGLSALDFDLADPDRGLPAVITAVVGVIVLALALSVVVVIAMDHGPGPGEVAVAYELAWDRLDFESLFTLSGAELRDGLDRRHFIAAKRAAYQEQRALGGLVEQAGVDQVATTRNAAVAITDVELLDHTTVRNRVEMARRNGRWLVVAYRLEPSAEAPRAEGPRADG